MVWRFDGFDVVERANELGEGSVEFVLGVGVEASSSLLVDFVDGFVFVPEIIGVVIESRIFLLFFLFL